VTKFERNAANGLFAKPSFFTPSPSGGKEQSLTRQQNATIGKAVPFQAVEEQRCSQREAPRKKQLQLSLPVNRTVEIRQEKTDGAGFCSNIYLFWRSRS